MILVWGVLVVLYNLPENIVHGENMMLGFCIHKLLLGFECPGCGMTRAIYSFLHLEVLEAIKFNFSIIGFIFLLFLQTLDSFDLLAKSKYKFTFVYFSFTIMLVLVYVKRITEYIIL